MEGAVGVLPLLHVFVGRGGDRFEGLCLFVYPVVDAFSRRQFLHVSKQRSKAADSSWWGEKKKLRGESEKEEMRMSNRHQFL